MILLPKTIWMWKGWRECQPGTPSAKQACPTVKQSASGTRARFKLRPGYGYVTSFFLSSILFFFFHFFLSPILFFSIRGFFRPSVGRSVHWSVGPLVREHESKSVKTRISAPAHLSATGIGRVSGLVFFHLFFFHSTVKPRSNGFQGTNNFLLL